MSGRPRRAKSSVCWFAPLQLLRTAQQVAIATVFGRNADARVIEALTKPIALESTAGAPLIHDYSTDLGPFWLDYIADTGDGWDATYTVAYYAAQEKLCVKPQEGSEQDAIDTRRGGVLVFGGDEVYPYANYEDYERRLVLPYSYAFPPRKRETANEPHVFAIPGNHDWYDSLVSFTRLFCSKQSFAGWLTPQARSYFALKLPAGWWLLGTDVQLGSEIDGPQREFFHKVGEAIPPDEKVILCHAEPHWLYETIYPATYRYRSVYDLERVFGTRIKLFLAGDCHFYARHEGPGGVQKIIAGGGGAFTHLTFGPDDDILRRRHLTDDPIEQAQSTNIEVETSFQKRCVYPAVRTSLMLLTALPVVFPFRNPSFGLATAVTYGITGQALLHPTTAARSLEMVAREAIDRVFTDPFSLFWVAATALGVIFFTDTHSRVYRWTGGFVHSFAQIAAAVLVGWAAAVATQAAFGPGSIAQAPATLALTAIGGYLVGPLILAFYLAISLLVFRRHRTDASSALRSPNYKNFVRLMIDPEGSLTVYPIGIGRVGTKWTQDKQPSSKLSPANGSQPFLIEEPIRISGR